MREHPARPILIGALGLAVLLGGIYIVSTPSPETDADQAQAPEDPKSIYRAGEPNECTNANHRPADRIVVAEVDLVEPEKASLHAENTSGDPPHKIDADRIQLDWPNRTVTTQATISPRDHGLVLAPDASEDVMVDGCGDPIWLSILQPGSQPYEIGDASITWFEDGDPMLQVNQDRPGTGCAFSLVDVDETYGHHTVSVGDFQTSEIHDGSSRIVVYPPHQPACPSAMLVYRFHGVWTIEG